MRIIQYLIIGFWGLSACQSKSDIDKHNENWALFNDGANNQEIWIPVIDGIVQTRNDGVAKFWYPSGRLESIQTYKDMQLNGYYCSFYENGQKKQEGFRVNDFPIDTLTDWYENGNLKQLRYYDDKGKQGIAKVWHDKGNIQVETYFVNDLKHGEYREYHSNGSLYKSGSYVNGKKVGTWTTWDDKGNILSTED